MDIRIFTLFILLPTLGVAQKLPEVISLIEKEMASKKMVGLAIAVIDSGKIVHLSAKGFSDLHHQKEATIHTPFHIASVSKVVTNMAVFQLVEANKLDLNTDINQYLPFSVKNPYYPNAQITVRDLLNHRSGIKDDFEFYRPHWTEPKGDPKLKLADFLKDYLDVNGGLYKESHYDSSAYYRSFAYSNTGIALLGLIVQHVSGMDYEQYCQQYIFRPLSMNNTSWFLRHLDSSLVAKTYVYQDPAGHIFKGHNGYPDYPGGQLRTSISDFSLLISRYLTSDEQPFILKRNTVDQITPAPGIAHEGFFSWFLTAFNNKLYYTHSGGDVGTRSNVTIDIRNKNGIIIFTNSEYDYNMLLKNIVKVMWDK